MTTMKRPHVILRVANWRTMYVPRQRDADNLLERICDWRTRRSRELLRQNTRNRQNTRI